MSQSQKAVAHHSTDCISAPRLSEVQGFDDARQHRARMPRRRLAQVSVRCLQLRTYGPWRLRRSYAFQGPWALAPRRFASAEVRHAVSDPAASPDLEKRAR